jgi:hypothetical protein
MNSLFSSISDYGLPVVIVVVLIFLIIRGRIQFKYPR